MPERKILLSEKDIPEASYAIHSVIQHAIKCKETGESKTILSEPGFAVRIRENRKKL